MIDDLDELVLLLKGSEAGPGAKPIATEPAPQKTESDQTGGERLPMTKLTKNRTKNTTNKIQAI